MAAQVTGKQRAVRIPLDYYKRPTCLERWKEWLGVVALVVSGGWLASGLLRSDGGDLRYSRGPVANVHQAWDANCAACHDSFVPIQSDHWASHWASEWMGKHGEEQKCQSCHAGPKHHASEKWAPSCAACHREHRGRDASLVSLDDRDCTQCHADLSAAVKPGVKLNAAEGMQRIRGFSKAQGHGDFQRLKDTAAQQRLEFNHKLHMSPGFITPEKGDPHFTLEKLKESDRQRYATNKQGQVQLDCASCHQLDNSGSKVSDLGKHTVRPEGAYMLPIRYDAHCQACHPLTIERKNEKDPLSGDIAVPHGLQPQDVRRLLEGIYTDKVLRNDLKDFEKLVGKGNRPMPGKKLEEPVRDYQKKIEAAERLLYAGKNACGECHHYEPKDALTEPNRNEALPRMFRIAPPKVPQVWFEHARFNHAAHRGVDCRSCHQNADGVAGGGANPAASTRSSDILIPGMDNCVQCHAPLTTSGGRQFGGVRHDCTECHRYHNGDHALQGLGAGQRDPKTRRGIDAFLNNAPEKGTGPLNAKGPVPFSGAKQEP